MPSIPESVRVKIERANKHIVDLDAAIAKFFERRPYSVVAYIDAERRATYCLKHIEPIDLCIPAIAGDAIQNLRTALDYLAGALWRRTNSGEWKGYFPVTDSAAKYKTEGMGKIKGMGQDAIDAIDAVEPYQGGKAETLWRLHSLSILTNTVCLSPLLEQISAFTCLAFTLTCSQNQRNRTRGYSVSLISVVL